MFHVVDQARVLIPDDPTYRFLGKPGDPVWLIPQENEPNIIWAGWSTEELGPEQVSGGIEWTLDAIAGPGSVAIFTVDLSGIGTLFLNSREGLPQSTHVILGTHAHANWSFSAEGVVYRLTFTVTGHDPTGARLRDTKNLQLRRRKRGSINRVPRRHRPGNPDYYYNYYYYYCSSNELAHQHHHHDIRRTGSTG